MKYELNHFYFLLAVGLMNPFCNVITIYIKQAYWEFRKYFNGPLEYSNYCTVLFNSYTFIRHPHRFLVGPCLNTVVNRSILNRREAIGLRSKISLAKCCVCMYVRVLWELEWSWLPISLIMPLVKMWLAAVTFLLQHIPHSWIGQT